MILVLLQRFFIDELMNNYRQTTNISSPILKDWNKDAIIPANPDATLLIIYTSGTTGSPNGVMLTYRNVVFNAFTRCPNILAVKDSRASFVSQDPVNAELVTWASPSLAST